jgi:Tfp pilus assembly protein PilO
MSSYFDKLNLTPAERRLVVIVGIVVFVVIQFWFVFPMFGEYGKYEQWKRDADALLQKYQSEIGKQPAYLKELKELEGQGAFVPTEEAALRLTQEINSQAALSGVTVTSIQPMTRQSATGKTNAFFEEATVTVSVNTGEKELIDFLYRLADKDLLIRAKSMNISTDPSQMRLQGQLTLVKSFQRKPPQKVSAAARPAAASPTPAPAPVPAKPVPSVPPPAAVKPAPGNTIPVPTPAPAGITNRPRRALPTPIKP